MTQGDESSDNQDVTQAYVEHKSVLASYLAQKLVQPEDIEDLLQETFEVALKSSRKRELRSPKGYLFIVARNLLSKRFAKQSRLMEQQIEYSEISNYALQGNSPENNLYYRIKLEILWEAMNSLPPQCKRVFLLRKVHGMSHKKIASTLKISTSTVERHITIALTRLNAIMLEKGYSHESDQPKLTKLRG